MNWYLKVLSNYAVFSGRARRKEYWMFFLFNTLISFGIGFILGFIAAMLDSPIIASLGYLYSLGVFIPGLAVTIRRYHDAGYCGWWILCPIFNFILLFFDSNPGTNKYGPNPKEEQVESV